LSEVDPRSSEARERKLHEFLEETKNAPVAPVPEKANDQHYELPPEFFELCLGEYRKYSCCYWSDGAQTLSEAERRALEITCERARLEDGQRILELGCGWGSLSLFMAERYPDSRITAVSNSAPQRESILERARQRGLSNLRVITCDMNDFDPKDFGVEEPFDRAVSIEMFEHMRNWHELLRRIRSWLQPEGLLFVHIFVHAHVAYVYESKGEEDWMGHYFFTGGIMPSADQLAHYGETMELLEQWRWNGGEYEKTANAWLQEARCPPRGGSPHPPPLLRRRAGRDLARALADLLHGLRRALGLPQRRRVVGRTLSAAPAAVVGFAPGVENRQSAPGVETALLPDEDSLRRGVATK
jgi:cyclopropane-fatty-acyl-phospholipid synthase